MEFEGLTDEAMNGGRVIGQKIFEWFDDLGVYHDLILIGSDVMWLSKMGVSIKGGHTQGHSAF